MDSTRAVTTCYALARFCIRLRMHVFASVFAFRPCPRAYARTRSDLEDSVWCVFSVQSALN